MIANPIRLLLLEDSDSDAMLEQATLAAAAPGEFITTRVSRLADALERVDAGHFDVVLSDLGLPDSMGLKTVQALVSHVPAMPLVVLTGSHGDGLGRAAILHGAQDFLVKGESSGALVARTLRHAVERKRLEIGLREANVTLEDALKVARESEECYRAVSQSANEALVTIDRTGNILGWNRGAETIFGYTDVEISLLPLTVLMPDRYREQHCAWMERVLTGGEQQAVGKAFEVEGLRKDGSEFPLELSLSKWEVAGNFFFTAAIRDISERKASEQHIHWLAHFDALTGLPNRVLAADRTRHSLSMVQRNSEPLALLFLDIDHFKNVNDSLGHHIGDALLAAFARRLTQELREQDTVSRFEGDEFILVLPGTDVAGAARLAKKLIEMVAQPYRIDPHELRITTSIGIAMYPDDAADFESLSKCADVAMHRAKLDGRNNCRFFTPEMQINSARAVHLESELHRALERNELSLHYQPQFSMRDGSIIGAEALLRWHHHELGMVSPAEFIPIAESSGQILPIGEWVLRSAVRQWKRWQGDGMAPMTIAVNLSAAQFKQPRLTDLVMRVLDEERLAPQYLELELTEGVAMDDPLAAIAVMDSLRQRGIRMSIDDFGTGYSSLSYLKRFKVYKLKIDQSFVRDITEDPEDRAIVSAIISLAGSLGMQTIAEGVETAGQLAFLRDKGCNEVQGFYFSRPLPAEQFEAFVRGKSGESLIYSGELQCL